MDQRPPEGGAPAPDEVELERWHGEIIDVWRARWGAPALHIFQTVGSTNDVARRLAAVGAPAGTVVLADEQTRGRGQRGRLWRSHAGASLSLSMLLRPRTPLQGPVLTLRLGIAAARALDSALRRPLHLKWPNDLVLPGPDRAEPAGEDAPWGKVGGILCEGVGTGGSIDYVVAGIGLNLRPPEGGWGRDIDGRPASLADVAVAPAAVPVPDVAGRVAAGWVDVARTGRETLSAAERAAFERRDVLRGRAISVEGRYAGVAAGISDTGALRVDTGSGVRHVRAGTVRTTETVQEERP